MAAVEHLVLFKIKDETSSSQEEAWLLALNNLKTLEGILYFRAARIIEISNSFRFTHALYARFSGKPALEQYAPHPEHLKVVAIGKQVCDDILALDWFVGDTSSSQAGVGDGPKYFIVAKLKNGVDPQVLLEVATVKQGLDGGFVSAGSDFSTRGKGFDFGFLLGTCSECPADELAAAGERLKTELDFLRGTSDSFLESSFVVRC